MAKKALFLLFILLLNVCPAGAEEILLSDISQDIEKNLNREMRLYSWFEIYRMSENSPDNTLGGDVLNALGRNYEHKLRTMPEPLQRALYKSYAKYLNIMVDNTGLRDSLKRYEKWTKLDVRFNVSESWQKPGASKQSTERSVLLETQAAVKISDSHIGLKFDPQGIDPDRFQNFTAFAEYRSAVGRLELRYSSLNKFSILAGKDNFLSMPSLGISGEYKTLDNRVYLDTAYRLSGGWQAKLSGSYGLKNDGYNIILIFHRSLN